MEETEKKPAPDVTPQEAKAEQFDGRNPHETQMDDLFGDMRREQAKEEEKEEMTLSNNARFAAKSPSNTAGARLAMHLFPTALRNLTAAFLFSQISASERRMMMLLASTSPTKLTLVRELEPRLGLWLVSLHLPQSTFLVSWTLLNSLQYILALSQLMVCWRCSVSGGADKAWRG